MHRPTSLRPALERLGRVTGFVPKHAIVRTVPAIAVKRFRHIWQTPVLNMPR